MPLRLPSEHWRVLACTVFKIIWTFNNNAGGEINIDQSDNTGLAIITGTFTNAANISIGTLANVGVTGLLNGATFNNNSGGEINIDRATQNGLFNQYGTFNNMAMLNIGTLTNSSLYAIRNQSIINNIGNGEILVDQFSGNGLLNTSNGVVNNAAKISIGADLGGGQNGIVNYTTINNNLGGEIKMTG